jgi:predicted nucleotide-binding protein (sugar kinase/HSP70/actin superfamily)
MDVVVPPLTSKRTLDLGVRYCPDMICAPCKLIFGNYVEALERGADTLIMLGGWGVCRLGYAIRGQQDKLRELGFRFEAVPFNLQDAQTDLIRVTQFLTRSSILNAFGAVRLLIDAMRSVESIERMALALRAREANKGDTDRVLATALQQVRNCRTHGDLRDFRQMFMEKFEAVAQDDTRDVLRVVLVGDPFTILDAFFNMDIERKLGALGVEVNRWFWLGDTIDLTHPIKEWFGLSRSAQARRAAAGYLRGEIGGFAYSTVGETILLAQEGYDGLIHLAPFNCTPEAVAGNILLSYDSHSPSPILHLSFDEHTSSTGLFTRLEAYTDLLRRRRQLKGKG